MLSALAILYSATLSWGLDCLMPVAASAAPAVAHHEHGATHAPGTDGVADEDTRGREQSCASIAACSLAAAPSARVVLSMVAPASGQRLEVPARTLVSIVLAPELPPPRA